jgi:hypothetical protein
MIIGSVGSARGKMPARGKRIPPSVSQRVQTSENRKRRLAGEADFDNEGDYENIEIERSKRGVLHVSNHSSRTSGMSYHTDLSH